MQYPWGPFNAPSPSLPLSKYVMSAIADFTDAELWAVHTALKERYGKDVDVQLADTEARLRAADRELTECPALFWSDGDASFVIVKTGTKNYRAQFYYGLHEQFGTGIDEFDDIAECTVVLLQTQADYESSRST